jgi:hypothetical protein
MYQNGLSNANQQYWAVVRCRFVESVGSCVHSLLLHCVHSVALAGFMLKRMRFVYAHHFNLLHKVASRVILETLRALDIATLSPVEALLKLDELKRKLES